MTNEEIRNLFDKAVDAINKRLDISDQHMSNVSRDVSSVTTEVKRNSSDVQLLYKSNAATQKKLASIEKGQIDCPARKTHEAGSLPGTKSSRVANILSAASMLMALVTLVILIITVVSKW